MSHHTEESIALIANLVNPDTEGGKIALKCKDLTCCSRGHCGYTHYRITNRSDCPTGCSMNVVLTDREVDKLTSIAKKLS